MTALTRQQRWIVFAASLAVGLAFLDETAITKPQSATLNTA